MDYTCGGKYPVKEKTTYDSIPVPPSAPKADPTSDKALRKEGLRQAKIQAFKNLYLKDLRHNPEKYLDSETTAEFHNLADSACRHRMSKHASVYVVTYNPPLIDNETAYSFFINMIIAIKNWKWVRGFFYVMEKAPKTGRPHIHMVIHTKEARFPSEIQRQIWVWAHSKHNMKEYEFLQDPGHNRSHVDVRPVLNGRTGITKAVNYTRKSLKNGHILYCYDKNWNETEEAACGSRGDVSYLRKPTSPTEEPEAPEEEEEEKIEE